ncbi:hypothetical protein Bca4012_073906 [Brassica carinata]|uniref:Uncharacterized protein n=1 Tax=Brassica carinata TaxID=52824 RepID=A0A8X7UD61_BRACI|nr:hypothetical protein Bca52824_066226 [Brassica carinata]
MAEEDISSQGSFLLPLRWKTVNVRLSGEDGEIGNAQWRRIAYESASSFALLESRRNSISSLFKMDMCPSCIRLSGRNGIQQRLCSV